MTSRVPRANLVFAEPSPSVALSDDDLGSMRDELEPTPPVLQSFSFAAKKRKPDVPASEDERAAGTRQVKKTKGPNNVVGVEQVERASLSGAHITRCGGSSVGLMQWAQVPIYRCHRHNRRRRLHPLWTMSDPAYK